MAAVPQQQAPREYSVVVIGAGIAGLCMGIQLRKMGIDDFVIFEKADGVGGTWRDNTYPGAACDVPAIFYSFSFELNPNEKVFEDDIGRIGPAPFVIGKAP